MKLSVEQPIWLAIIYYTSDFYRIHADALVVLAVLIEAAFLLGSRTFLIVPTADKICLARLKRYRCGHRAETYKPNTRVNRGIKR